MVKATSSFRSGTMTAKCSPTFAESWTRLFPFADVPDSPISSSYEQTPMSQSWLAAENACSISDDALEDVLAA